MCGCGCNLGVVGVVCGKLEYGNPPLPPGVPRFRDEGMVWEMWEGGKGGWDWGW